MNWKNDKGPVNYHKQDCQERVDELLENEQRRNQKSIGQVKH